MKKCKIQLNKVSDGVIAETANLFTETISMLNDIKDHNYSTKNEKVENIPEATELEDQCNVYKNKFEELTKRIKAQNRRLIERAKSSFRFSYNSISTPDKVESNNVETGKDFLLDSTDNKEKQNSIIDEAHYKISSVSRRNSIQNFIMQTTINNKDESIKMEKKIMSALDGSQSGFFTKKKVYILLLIIILIIIVYLVI